MFAQELKYVDGFLAAEEVSRLVAQCQFGATRPTLIPAEINNPIDKDGHTLLHIAIVHGYARAAKTLVEMGADVHARTCTDVDMMGDWTYLHWAANCTKNAKNADVVEMLMEHGADVNAVSPRGDTPLYVATQHAGNFEAVKALVRRGASLEAVDHRGATVLERAVRAGHTEVVQWLKDYANYTTSAALRGTSAAKQEAVAACTDVKDPIEMTHLTKAHHRLCFDWILEDGLDVRTGSGVCKDGLTEPTPTVGDLDVDAWTAANMMFIAVVNGWALDIETLVKTGGADVNVWLRPVDHPTNCFPTYLHCAAHGGHADVIEMLVKYGADVNAQSPSGDTPVVYAAAFGNFEAVKALVQRGASLQVLNGKGRTALQGAVACGHTQIAQWLADYAASTRATLPGVSSAAAQEQQCPAPTMPPHQTCAKCGASRRSAGDDAAPLQHCSGCRSVLYCSKACQKRHWKAEHRTQCSGTRRAVRTN